MASTDLPQLFTLLKDIKEKAEASTKQIESVQKRVTSENFSTAKGVSLLEVKYQLLLSYLSDLALVLLVKVEGRQLDGQPAVERLVEIRTVLEKIRPLDQKLKYQVDKLLKVAATTPGSSADPLRFRPNPANLVSELQDGDDDDENTQRDSSQAGNPGVYVPPKLAAVPYTLDNEKVDRRKRRHKEEHLSKTLLQELKQEYWTGPEEVREDIPGRTRHQKEEEEERVKFEEDHFLRLPEKKKKRSHLRDSGVAELDRLTSFDDRKSSSGKSSKKRAFGKFGKSSKKGKKGRR